MRDARHGCSGAGGRPVRGDLVLGHDLDPDRPFLGRLLESGGDALLGLPRLEVDVLGLDYRAENERFHTDVGVLAPSPVPVGLRQLLGVYGRRYELPMVAAGSSIRGAGTDRLTWFRHVLQQYDGAREDGWDLRGLCWVPTSSTSSRTGPVCPTPSVSRRAPSGPAAGRSAGTPGPW